MQGCMRDGCKREGRWAPRICVPATGWPRDHKPVTMVFGLQLCEEHFAEVSAQDFLDPSLPEPNLRGALEILAQGRAAPDFQRAYIRRVDTLLDPQWQALELARRFAPKH